MSEDEAAQAARGRRRRSSRRTAAGRSPIDVELVAGDGGRAGRAAAGRRRRRTGSRAGPPRAAGGRCSATGPTARRVELTPAPFNVRNRVHEYGGGSYAVARGRVVASSLADGRLWRLAPRGRREPVALTPEGPWRYADLRFDPRRARACTPSARRTTPGASTTRAGRQRARRDRARRLGRRGPGARHGARTSSRRRGPSPDGSDASPGSSGTSRTCPGTRCGCGSPTSRPTGRWASRGRSPAGRGSASSSRPGAPTGVLHAVSDETGWWNLYAFDGPRRHRRRAARNLAPMDAELGEPGLGVRRQSYGFLARRRRCSPWPRADGRGRLPPDRARRHGDRALGPAVHRGRRAAGRRRRRGRRDRRRARATARSLVRLDARDRRGRGRARPLAPGPARPARTCPSAEPITFAHRRRRHGPGALLPADQPGVPRPRRRAAAADRRCRTAGPTGAAYSGAVAGPRVLHLARHRRRRRRLPRARPATGGRTATRSGASGAIADVEDCVAAARFLVDRGDVGRRRGSRSAAAAPAATRRSRRSRSGREVFAAGISHFGIADLELIHQRRPQVRVALRRGPARARGPRRAARCSATARRSTSSTGAGPDAPVPGPRRQGRAAVAAGRDGGGVRARAACPHVAMRFEGEGHGFRARGDAAGHVRGGARVPRPRVRLRAGRRRSPPLEIPGLETFAAAMAGAAAGGDIR